MSGRSDGNPLLKHLLGFLFLVALLYGGFSLRLPELLGILAGLGLLLLEDYFSLSVDLNLAQLHFKFGLFLHDSMRFFSLHLVSEILALGGLHLLLLCQMFHDDLFCLLGAEGRRSDLLGLNLLHLFSCSVLVHLSLNIVIEAFLFCSFHFNFLNKLTFIVLNSLEMLADNNLVEILL